VRRTLHGPLLLTAWFAGSVLVVGAVAYGVLLLRVLLIRDMFRDWGPPG
jgi:hypothetical protein